MEKTLNEREYFFSFFSLYLLTYSYSRDLISLHRTGVYR